MHFVQFPSPMRSAQGGGRASEGGFGVAAASFACPVHDPDLIIPPSDFTTSGRVCQYHGANVSTL